MFAKKKHQRGYSLVELVFAVSFFVIFAMILYIMAHFIMKFW